LEERIPQFTYLTLGAVTGDPRNKGFGKKGLIRNVEAVTFSGYLVDFVTLFAVWIIRIVYVRVDFLFTAVLENRHDSTDNVFT
jgi:hypothetical protein